METLAGHKGMTEDEALREANTTQQNQIVEKNDQIVEQQDQIVNQ